VNFQKFLITLGFLLLLGSFGVTFFEKQQYVDVTHAQAVTDATNESYTKIIVPKISVDISIQPGGVVNGKWILTNDYAHYFTQNGNTIVYAHKRKGLFVDLKKLSEGDTIILVNNKGEQKTFTVYSLEIVKSTESEKLQTNEPNTVTLFTCDGFFDENRIIVKAK